MNNLKLNQCGKASSLQSVLSRFCAIALMLLLPFASSAQVTFVGSETVSGDGVSLLIVPAPAGIQVDDLLVGVVATSNDNPDIFSALGWAEQFEVNNAAEADLAVFYKVADLGDTTAPVFTFGMTADQQAIASVLVYRGVDPVSPIVGHATALGTADTAVAPDFNVATDVNTKVIRIVSWDQQSDITVPPGTTERVDVVEPLGPGGQSLTIADADQASTGATGTATFTDGDFGGYVAATFVIKPPQGPELTVDKTTSTPLVNQFDQATYTISIANGSTGTAPGDVTVTDTLPVGFDFASASFTTTGGATGPGGGSSGVLSNDGTSGVPGFEGFTMPADSTVTITLIADIDDLIATGVYSNSVTVSSDSSAFASVSDDGSETDEDVAVITAVSCAEEFVFNSTTISLAGDGNLLNNADSVCVTLTPTPIIEVVKTDSPDPVRRGETLTFTLSITNSAESPVGATNVEITDVLPAGLTWISTMNGNGGGTCTTGDLVSCNCSAPGNTGTVTCDAGDFAIGETKTVMITTTVD